MEFFIRIASKFGKKTIDVYAPIDDDENKTVKPQDDDNYENACTWEDWDCDCWD